MDDKSVKVKSKSVKVKSSGKKGGGKGVFDSQAMSNIVNAFAQQVCCNVLQCVAVCCSVLQAMSNIVNAFAQQVCCSVLQRVVCSVL